MTRPPFGPGVDQWFSKLYQERSAGRTSEAIVLWKSATETAAWIDRQAGVKLCEHCYGREVRENAREVGLV